MLWVYHLEGDGITWKVKFILVILIPITAKFPSLEHFPLDAEGQLESFQIGTRIGYAIPFGEKGWFRTAGGFGFANRRDVLNIQIPPNNSAYISSETAFTYDLLLGLGYEVGLGLDGFLAYRLLGISDNGGFDSVTMHLFRSVWGQIFKLFQISDSLP